MLDIDLNNLRCPLCGSKMEYRSILEPEYDEECMESNERGRVLQMDRRSRSITFVCVTCGSELSMPYIGRTLRFFDVCSNEIREEEVPVSLGELVCLRLNFNIN